MRAVTAHAGLVTLAFAIAATACSAQEVPLGATIDGAELAARIAKGTAPIVLDVRTPEEFASGHVPGALNVPHTELAARLSQLGLAKEDEIVVHCESGRRAAMAEAALREAGYTGVRDLDGHMKLWRSEERPIELPRS